MADHPIGVTEHGDIVFQLRTETIIVRELRDELTPLLEEVCEIMSKARSAGLQVAWNIQPNSFGRKFRVVEISVVKPL